MSDVGACARLGSVRLGSARIGLLPLGDLKQLCRPHVIPDRLFWFLWGAGLNNQAGAGPVLVPGRACLHVQFLPQFGPSPKQDVLL